MTPLLRDGTYHKEISWSGGSRRCLAGCQSWRGACAGRRNGAGKSTLIKILYGVYQPDTGSIAIEGRKRKSPTLRDAISQGIGRCVPQELNVCPHLDVANNIFLGCIKVKFGVIDDKWAIEETKKILKETVKLEVDPTSLMKDLPLQTGRWWRLLRWFPKG